MLSSSELLSSIEGIYAGILDDAAWGSAIEGLCRALGGETAGLALHDAHSLAVVRMDYVAVDPGYQGSYGQLISLPDMAGAFRVVMEAATSGALTGEDMLARAPDFERSRFRDEWLRSQGILDLIAAPFIPTPTVVGGLFVGRPRAVSRFGSDQLGVLRALNAHLVRAVQVRLRLNEVSSAANAALAALDVLTNGVMLVDPTSAVIHANLSADAALRQSDGMTMIRSVLVCDHADDTATLRRLVGEASARSPEHSGGMATVRRRSGRRPLSVLVAPLRGAGPISVSRRATAIMLLADPEAVPRRMADALRLAYGLTAAEARTALALLDHARLADVAEALGVSLATVRTLLQRAFDKTDTHTQTELVRLMLAHRLPAVPEANATSPPASSARTSPPP